MFRKIVEAIKNGDLDGLKEILEKRPGLIGKEFKWDIVHLNAGIHHTARILHIAASYNQPEIIEYLITKKGMGIDSQGYCWKTPLHHAVHAKAYQAAKVLLELGADPGIGDVNGKTPFDCCKDEAAKELLRSVYQEQQRIKELARQEREKQLLEEKEKETAARIEGRWKPLSASKIMFERDLPEEGRCLREIFDFAAGSLLLASKNLEDGQRSQETIYWDDETKGALKAKIAEARAQLDKANGDIPEIVLPVEVQKVRPAISGFRPITQML